MGVNFLSFSFFCLGYLGRYPTKSLSHPLFLSTLDLVLLSAVKKALHSWPRRRYLKVEAVVSQLHRLQATDLQGRPSGNAVEAPGTPLCRRQPSARCRHQAHQRAQAAQQQDCGVQIRLHEPTVGIHEGTDRQVIPQLCKNS